MLIGTVVVALVAMLGLGAFMWVRELKKIHLSGSSDPSDSGMASDASLGQLPDWSGSGVGESGVVGGSDGSSSGSSGSEGNGGGGW